MTTNESLTRVAAYIDGYNVYHGMRSKGWRRYQWLDYRALLGFLLLEFSQVKYFTAIANAAAAANARLIHRSIAPARPLRQRAT